MTSHGFGKPDIHSSKISIEEIGEIAKQISLVKPITRSHIVQHGLGDKVEGYDIIFEFGHLKKHDPPMTHADLLKKLMNIPLGGHHITGVDFWIIQDSYEDGKLISSHLQVE